LRRGGGDCGPQSSLVANNSSDQMPSVNTKQQISFLNRHRGESENCEFAQIAWRVSKII
jgi:hypothetical protein